MDEPVKKPLIGIDYMTKPGCESLPVLKPVVYPLPEIGKPEE